MVTGDEFLYGKHECPRILRALDDIATEVNTKIRMRGIARGMVCVQESFNKQILTAEKLVYNATRESDPKTRLKSIESILRIMKFIWVDIRFMLKQKALTVGEIGVLSKKAKEAQSHLIRWHKANGGNSYNG